MRTLFDQLAKAILGALLRPVVTVDTAREIRGHVQIADLRVEPDPAHAAELARLGVLGRMLESGPCLIEPFSRAPGRTFRRALDELLGQQSWARRLLEPVLVAFRREMPQDQMSLWEDEDMEALRHFEAVYADWEKRVKDEARKEGLEEGRKKGLEAGREAGCEAGLEAGLRQGERKGLVESIEMLCDAFGLPLSDERRARLASSDIEQLKAMVAAISTTRRWPES